MAWPPWALINPTMSLLISPPSTICTTSMVASFVTRMPSTKWDSIFSCSSRSSSRLSARHHDQFMPTADGQHHRAKLLERLVGHGVTTKFYG